MRIALVSPYDLAVPGGVQGQVTGLAAALAGRGDEVLVLAPGPARGRLGAAGGFAREGMGRVLRVPANGSRAPVSLAPAAVVRTRRALAGFDPEVVHVHEPFVPLPALVAGLWGAAPVLGTFHRAGDGTAYRLAGPLLRGVLDRLAGVVAVSEPARATLEAVVGSGTVIEILPNAVDLSRFSAAPPFPSEGPTVVFAGRHERRKGLDLLLSAFTPSKVRARCWVVGDGPERRGLQAAYGGDPRVEWLGALSDAELARRVAGADLLVAPSRSGESFGVVLLEAMAAGTAVLAAELDGYRLAGGEAAAYFPPGNGVALRRSLEHLLASPAERDRLAALGRQRASRRGFEELAEAYRARYEALRRGGAGRRGDPGGGPAGGLDGGPPRGEHPSP